MHDIQTNLSLISLTLKCEIILPKPWNTLWHIGNIDQNWVFRLPKFKYLPLAEGLGSSEGGQKRGRQGPHDPQGPTSQSLGHATSHLNTHHTTIRFLGKHETKLQESYLFVTLVLLYHTEDYGLKNNNRRATNQMPHCWNYPAIIFGDYFNKQLPRDVIKRC